MFRVGGGGVVFPGSFSAAEGLGTIGIGRQSMMRLLLCWLV